MADSVKRKKNSNKSSEEKEIKSKKSTKNKATEEKISKSDSKAKTKKSVETSDKKTTASKKSSSKKNTTSTKKDTTKVAIKDKKESTDKDKKVAVKTKRANKKKEVEVKQTAQTKNKSEDQQPENDKKEIIEEKIINEDEINEVEPIASEGQFEEEKAEDDLPRYLVSIEDITAQTSKDFLSQAELEEIDKSRRERGEALADRIFELANKQRSQDLDLYAETIFEAVKGKCSEENQAILRTACRYFKDKYTKWCRERGKSVEMLDNIVHRTGPETEEFLAKLLHGFDVKALSRELWTLDLEKKMSELRVARRQMYELTNDQVRELREEYNSIPAQDLAALIHDALNATNLTDEPKPDAETIKYILQGRSAFEVKQIEFRYNERFHYVRSGDGEPLLKDIVKTKFSDKTLEEIETLLKGFNSRELADEIHNLLVNCSEASEVLEDGIKLHPDFAGNFRRDYSKASNIERELRAHEQIDALTMYLTPNQLKNVNRLLGQHYSEQITPILYKCNYDFNPRKVAIELFRSFQNVPQRRVCKKMQDYLDYQQVLQIKSRFTTSTHSEITAVINKWAEEQKAQESFQIIKQAILPIENLDPTQMFFVREWFYVCTGISLDDFIKERVNYLCQNEVPKYVTNLLKLKLSGIARLPLKADLFDLFSSAEQRKQNFLNIELQAKQIKQAEEDVETLNKILAIKQDTQKNKELIAFLRQLDRDRSNAMEKAYLDSSKGTPLLEALRNKIKSKECLSTATYLLSQFDVLKFAKRIDENPENLLELWEYSSKAVAFVLQQYKAIYKKDLFVVVRSKYKTAELLPTRLLLETILFTPNVLKIHHEMKVKFALSEDAMDFILRQLNRPRLEVLALEAAHNHYFARFEYCQDIFHGSLLQQLRVLATAEKITRECFASAILLLEYVDPSVPVTIQNHLSADEIGGVAIIKLHSLLREFKAHLKILQKAFNALNPEATLRETIYELSIPLEVKNKTLLLLDGYDPDLVAKEIINAMQKSNNPEIIGRRVCAILEAPTQERPNPRIPYLLNWISEMYHQIRVSYEAQKGTKLVADLIRAKVPMKGFGVNTVAYKLYGEVAKTVIDIRHLICLKGTDKDQMGIIDRKIVQTLTDLVPALRERALNMYDAYYSDALGSLSLLDENKNISNHIVRENGIAAIQQALTWDVPEGKIDGD